MYIHKVVRCLKTKMIYLMNLMMNLGYFHHCNNLLLLNVTQYYKQLLKKLKHQNQVHQVQKLLQKNTIVSDKNSKVN